MGQSPCLAVEPFMVSAVGKVVLKDEVTLQKIFTFFCQFFTKLGALLCKG